MVRVFRLAYVHFGCTDVPAMVRYYTEVMGLSLTEQETGRAYLSTSFDHHNVILSPSSEPGLKGFGLQLAPDISAAEAYTALQRMGISAEMKADSLPAIPEIVQFTDMDGFEVHLFSQMEATAPGFQANGIVPNKVGHLSLRVRDAKRSVEYYKQFGFVNTDWIESFFGFMTCNRDHHVLNFCTSDRKGMHHLAFELRDYSHLVRSMDYLSKHQIPVVWGPSRHGAGHNIATYHRDPEGNMIELFTDADVFIPELNMFEPRPWHETIPQRPRVWGTDECITRWGTAFEEALV
ncbi:MAG: VOC family protein [Alicyclobacillus macrosporangiidus]|uniref:VOC family protein n=1 Tax=Alicyclobacillus macrosporangiidus TaxID=392015 RepID=UPI0026ED2BBD|nr:VOC family protein [Alicyclobacillus macrosporangiidus]MCL6597846.1 VOC family protein [Alicyclobacillus macrosporangiidus]